ncbi:hypothetical protein SporoP37_12225 [Sporosarcina sp. P37]|nr:hypothetical protein SporoP37_12225 [Sporosarcina sp. P37]
MTTDEFDEIFPFFHYIRAKKNTYLFKQHEPLDGLYFLIHGKIKIFKTNSQGKEQLVNLYYGKDIFPHIGHYFHTKTYPANALTLQDADIFAISAEHIEQLLLKTPALTMYFLQVMGEKVVDLQNRLEEKLLGTTAEQVTGLLIRLADRHGHPVSDQKIRLNETFQNTDLANMIGITRETVSRTMTALYAEEVLTKDEKGRLIIDMPRMKKLTGGE